VVSAGEDQPIEAAIPSLVVVVSCFLGREEFMRDDNFRGIPDIVKFDGHERFTELRLRLPAPCVRELFRRANLVVHSCEVEDVPVRGLPYPQTVFGNALGLLGIGR
jgi:hypothetical protein